MHRRNASFFLASLGFVGCGPFIADSINVETGAETSEDSNAPEDDSEADDNTETDEDLNEEDSSGAKTLTSGTWTLTDADLEQDSCGMMSALAEYSASTNWDGDPISFDMFLPSRFDVSATQDRFRIKALNYRAAGYIECTFSGENFACSTQTADSTQVTSGWPTYWTYQIEFSGTYIDSRTLVGDAVVTFPKVNPGDDYGMQVSGLGRPQDCPQTYRLTLKAGGA